jgi:hypothetical protein
MPCCGGKKGARPISRLRYVLGSAAIVGYHGVAGAALEGAALFDKGFLPVARFHRAFLSDLLRSVVRREGIVLAGGEAKDRCAPGGRTT